MLGKSDLLDKIKGGWVGQTIGVTYGAPTEFNYNSRIIPDSVEIPWPENGYGLYWWHHKKKTGLYDDVYMDLTFVDIYNRYGLDAPVDCFAMAFARADYHLFHANQAARYNILSGIMPPVSGHWQNNPHADCIDFQIESDFAGLMSPGMPVTSSEICDKIGHIMNYGDGWYGGVYISGMYSLAFLTDDIGFIVNEALKSIPEKSDFRRCIEDVIGWCGEYEDWKDTWQALETKWGNDLSCPKGFEEPFNIEAKMNAAYVVMGLLYGEGNFGRTIDIAARCGQDSDCNPASAGGILGTVTGYSRIPEKWMNNIREVEDLNFPFTEISLNEVYDMSLEHALELVERGGGTVGEEVVEILCQAPEPVRYEKSFEGMIPVLKKELNMFPGGEKFSFPFEGKGIVLTGQIRSGRSDTSDYVGKALVHIDGEFADTLYLPADFRKRKFDIYWNFSLEDAPHRLEMTLLNPDEGKPLELGTAVIYAARK